MSKPEEAAPPERPWVILSSVPDVVGAALLKWGKHLSLDVNKPPGISVLKVASGLIPDIKPATQPIRYPYITAADPSGLLLCASHLSDWWYYTSLLDFDDVQTFDVDNKLNAYFLCDTTTRTAFKLPDRVEPDDRIHHSSNVGLVRRGDDQFMVAELQPKTGTDVATLFCYSPGSDAWVRKKLKYFPEHPEWGNNGAISHGGKLWWVDLSFGLLTCDPFVEKPDLRYVQLPPGCVLDRDSSPYLAFLDIDKHRCVKVSGGKLRYVQIDDAAADASKQILMWTLDHPEGTEWTLQYRVPFTEIWGDESYRDTGLWPEVPVLALVHPWNPDVVYFWQKYDKWIFAVDVPKRKVLSCEYFDKAHDSPAREFPSSRLVQAWELPRPDPDDGPFGWLRSLVENLCLLWFGRRLKKVKALPSTAGN